MTTIHARLFGGPYDGESVEISDRHLFFVVRAHPLRLDPPLGIEDLNNLTRQIGRYERELRTEGWLEPPFIWRGWE